MAATITQNAQVDIQPGIINDGLIRHYDFANRNGYKTANGYVWNDLSPYKINAKTTGALLPTHSTTKENGYGGLIFEGESGVGPRLEIPYVNLGTDSWAVDLWITHRLSNLYLRGYLAAGDIWSTPTPINPAYTGWAITCGTTGGITMGMRWPIAYPGTPQNFRRYGGGTAYTSSNPTVAHIFMHRSTISPYPGFGIFEVYVNGLRRGWDYVENSINIDNAVSTTIRSDAWWEGGGLDRDRPRGTFHVIKLYKGIDIFGTTDANEFFTSQFYSSSNRFVLRNYNALCSRFGMPVIPHSAGSSSDFLNYRRF
jgi:hypothetical protein